MTLSNKGREKQLRLFIFPSGDGEYRANWHEGKYLYQAFFNIDGGAYNITKTKNPYKNNVCPWVTVDWDEQFKTEKPK